MVELAVLRNDYKTLEVINSMECKLFGVDKGFKVDPKVIKIAKMKADGSSDEDIREAETLVDGVIDLNKLVASNDLAFITKMIQKYPVTKWETFNSFILRKDYKGLAKFSEENHLPFTELIGKDQDLGVDEDRDIGTRIISWVDSDLCTFNEEVRACLRSKKYFMKPNEEWLIKLPYGELKPFMESLAILKKKIIDDAAISDVYASTAKEMTKNYLEKMLENGNTDMLVIKLCVRLEAYLRSTCKMTGDFSEMLVKWCNANGTVNDDCGYPTESRMSQLFHKLRIKRNSLVHPEQKGEDLSFEELRQCIDFICDGLN
jgi:hypothetical protein